MNAIHIFDLGKRYRLARTSETLSETVGQWFSRLVGGSKVRQPVGAKPEFVWAVNQVNLEIDVGEVVGIVGGNGAGKSTLLKMISRVTTPTTGGIDYRGRCASLLEVGTGFHPDLSGRDNIFMNASLLGMPRREVCERMEQIVEFAGVGRYLDVAIKRYSSGMRIRLGFAVAAHLEPDILIVDEVLAVGDAEFQSRSLRRMEEISSDGRTVLFVSHNMASVRQLCSRVIVMDAGRVVADNTAEKSIDHYLGSSSTSRTSAGWNRGTIRFAPGVEFQPTRIEMIQASGACDASLKCDQAILYQLSLRTVGNLDGFRTGMLIQTLSGTTVFGSNHEWTQDIPTHHRTVSGESRSRQWLVTCEVPAFTLNEGIYRLCIGFDRRGSSTQSVNFEDCLQFEVLDLVGHGPGREKLPGLCRPALKWNVEPVGP